MPIYEYTCPRNGVTLEVSHAMRDRVTTWGDLCERTGHARGATPADSPVEKVVSMPIAHGSNAADGEIPPGACGPSCGCAGL